jgi:hypothetical protein
MFRMSYGLGNEGGSGGNATLVGRLHGPWGMDVLLFLMIGRLDKLAALCRYIANSSNSCNNAGRWNEDTPSLVIQNMGGGQRKLRIDDIACPKGVEVVAGEHSEIHQRGGSHPVEC